jgi:hypothetical protein
MRARCWSSLALALSLMLTRPASASPPASAEAPPERSFAGGFSLERGAWLATPHLEFGIGLLTTLRYGATFTSAGVDSLGFSLPFVRPNLHASLFDGKLRFLIQPELSGPSVRLLDAQVVYQPIPAFGLDLGQYRPHVSRAWNTPIPLLAMPGRGVVDDAFHTDRALGATLFGRPLGGKLEYDLGVFNGGGYNLGQPVQLEPLATWRLAVNPLGPVPYTQTPAFAEVEKTVFGLAAHGWTDRFRAEQVDPQIKPIAHQRITAGGELVLMTRRVHLLVEGFGRWAVAKSSLFDAGWGSQAQFGVMLLPRTLELQARAGVLDLGLHQPVQGVWEGGLSWYLWGNHLRAQLHYGCTQHLPAPSGCTSQRAELQTQLWF